MMSSLGHFGGLGRFATERADAFGRGFGDCAPPRDGGDAGEEEPPSMEERLEQLQLEITK